MTSGGCEAALTRRRRRRSRGRRSRRRRHQARISGPLAQTGRRVRLRSPRANPSPRPAVGSPASCRRTGRDRRAAGRSRRSFGAATPRSAEILDDEDSAGDHVRRFGRSRSGRKSRESLPKQFIPLIGDRSTFQSIVGVVGDRAIFELPVVITNFDYRFRVVEQLKEIGAEATILLEPERRDSAAAVGAAAARAAARGPKTLVAVLAADHVFKEGEKFAQLCARAGVAADSWRDRHLRRHPRPSGDQLRLYSSRRTTGGRSPGPARRALRREAERGTSADLHRAGLFVELG